MESILSEHINGCARDMDRVASSVKISPSVALDLIVKGYDTYDLLLQVKECSSVVGTEFLQDGTIENYLMEYSRLASKLKKCFDKESLMIENQARIKSLDIRLERAEKEVERAVELHNLAKETFEIWENGGFISKYVALRRLRKSAGFRLEKDRIGNYVARTFDLMNQARMNYAKEQQARFKGDVSYKIIPDIYHRIATLLKEFS